ncbi:L,D-transpeptidase [Bifidobacterium aemilianum]|uniref:L,D-transpeptidase n=2 Tax=Bifidobacterium aemilianum TaxID=2493120 RepID=A0A366K8K7_9BIFI|nr:L,D-transpeptidase [Bifidobacterium aemilianum]
MGANSLLEQDLEAVSQEGRSGAGFDPDETATMAALNPRVDNHQHKLRMAVIIGIVLALILLVLASFFGANWYFKDRVAPGVSFGSAKVTGQTPQEVRNTVKQTVKDSTITLKDAKGKVVRASLEDLGVKVNVDHTADKLLEAKQSKVISHVNPLARQDVGLDATVNQLALNDFLVKSFVGEDDRALPSSIAYDPGSSSFVAKEGKGGRSVVSKPVSQEIDDLINHPGQAKSAKVSYEQVPMPIAVDKAQQAADEANKRLTLHLTIGNGNAKSIDLPADQRASWIEPKGDLKAGTISIDYKKQAIDEFAAKSIPEQLNQAMVSQEDVVDDKGTVLLTTTKGVDGVNVKNTNTVADQILKALQNDQPADIKADADVTPHDVKQKKSEWRIVVDKSNQTATVYQNGNVVKSFPVCTGMAGSYESDTGTFAIYLKYAIQDMRGLNNDGSKYLIPGVKWVSYYNGGESFHTASWNPVGIATGDPTHRGSHGCINMYEQDSQWIYDHCPEGTIVQVIGTRPDGPVR